ncbi:ASCH domain-containing protein [Cryomorphaceae bacterium 1068]|nr:ASCH domain-containing protein [Cryomorphaceae bacterium 1068]
MKVLLAIKEEYASKIFDGTKKYEFRKSIFKDQRVKTIVVYVSAPVQQVIGEFDIDQVYKDEPQNIWEQTKAQSGVSKDFFDLYFLNRSNAYAIKIKKTRKYPKPKALLEDFNMSFAPQSYVYL